ncbi:MAG: ABC transporter ATP-binding protein [bacterium]|nr:ABC transporter ATP-binding protein [bacterium]MCP4966594.1 ABC transporter ATP-binding protein [bacterium]
MPTALAFSHVTRTFGDITAVDDLSLEVPEGSITVLLGPNGAGKTTTVRLATGALGSDEGSIEVLGLDPLIAGNEVRSRCAVVPPKPALYDNLTGWENLTFTADIFSADHKGIKPAAERFGIDHALDLNVGGYSTGMRTRLALARAVLHDPDVLLLDEPTAGLDPESARAVLNLIRELAGRGRTIVLCTHLLHEAEGVADQVVLMGAGQAQIVGSQLDLADRYVTNPAVIIDAEDRDSLSALSRHDDVVSAEWNGALHVRLTHIDRLPGLVADLVGAGARITRVEPDNPTLETLYFEMQRSLRGQS